VSAWGQNEANGRIGKRRGGGKDFSQTSNTSAREVYKIKMYTQKESSSAKPKKKELMLKGERPSKK